MNVEHLEQPAEAALFRFTIEDTGIGIPTETLGRIFERFTQADAATARLHGGSGLGLAISRQLAELMGGGLQAIEMWSASRYDVVFMDCQMPRMDGFEATAEIRRRERGTQRHTPIVAVTANTVHGNQTRCMAAGMDDFIAKPFDSTILDKALQRWGRAT